MAKIIVLVDVDNWEDIKRVGEEIKENDGITEIGAAMFIALGKAFQDDLYLRDNYFYDKEDSDEEAALYATGIAELVECGYVKIVTI